MNKSTLMSVQVIDFYLDWVNNYLTISCIAEHHGLDEDDAKALINMGRHMHHNLLVTNTLEYSEVTA